VLQQESSINEFNAGTATRTSLALMVTNRYGRTIATIDGITAGLDDSYSVNIRLSGAHAD
jgi:hypothetical protein